MHSRIASSDLSPDQIDIIDAKSHARIMVVRAGPGTGKTRLFVANLQRLISSWTGKGGVAALSFTNAASDEITERIGESVHAPHYVGTLDSFIWRFVIQPFAYLAKVSADGPRLLPDPIHKTHLYPCAQVGPEERLPIFQISLQMHGSELQVYRESRHGGMEKVPKQYHERIVEMKKNEWLTNGRLTHGDSHAIAWKLLKQRDSKRAIVKLLSQRFPVILLDEFQDTNRYLGEVIIELLKDSQISALIVGDQDQSIYSFGGVDKGLLKKIEALDGSISRSLRTTYRFGTRIAAVAASLSRSGEPIVPTEGMPPGRVLVIPHSGNRSNLDPGTRRFLENLLESEGLSSIAFLARRNSWLRALGGTGTPPCPLKSLAAKQLHRAICELREGNNAVATRLSERVMENLRFDKVHVTQQDLRSCGIDSRDWAVSVGRLLLAADGRGCETWANWLDNVRKTAQAQVEFLGSNFKDCRIGHKLKQKSGSSQEKFGTIDSQGQSRLPGEVLTIHRAKGREFDGVVIFWPKPGSKIGCPSDEWWSTDPDLEEREIAYVAATRAKKLLIFCVHHNTLEALRRKRPDFLALCEVVSSTDQ